MKATNYTAIAISMAVLLSINIESAAQSNRSASNQKSQPESNQHQNDGYTRNERRHSTNNAGANTSSTRYETSKRESGPSNSTYQSNNKGHNDNRNQSDNHRKTDYSNSDKQHGKKGDNGNHYGQKNKSIDKYERYDHGNHHHYGNHDRHNKYEYNVHSKRLPGKKYHHYQLNGDSYYHCDGLFYRYTPSVGYYRVKCPYIIVPALPARFIVRYYNGQQLAFHQGYYYVPMEYGWMLVPEVAAPQFSMNIAINF
jgi:hypothetical protein